MYIIDCLNFNLDPILTFHKYYLQKFCFLFSFSMLNLKKYQNIYSSHKNQIHKTYDYSCVWQSAIREYFCVYFEAS